MVFFIIIDLYLHALFNFTLEHYLHCYIVNDCLVQAAMSSDFNIAQFRFLERLLLLHGHWCYRRISMMVIAYFLEDFINDYYSLFWTNVYLVECQICYFFYKNITFGLTLFWFETHSSFSAQPAYNDWYMSTYNVFFTSLPVIALGVFEQDVSARLCLKVCSCKSSSPISN